jgi:hypothetical protein
LRDLGEGAGLARAGWDPAPETSLRNGKDDMQLYTENITGPAACFDDLDSAMERDVGNLMPPASEADAVFGPLNQQMWRMIDS